jgi:hypothetical protein
MSESRTAPLNDAEMAVAPVPPSLESQKEKV